MICFGKSPRCGDDGDRRDLLIAGVPRSGTTLACRLLNDVDNVVALHEAMDVSLLFRRTGAEDIRRRVARFCELMRRSVLADGTAVSKHVGGAVPDNSYAAARGSNGLRANVAVRGEIRIARRLTPQFTLVVKHPAAFTVFIETLAPEFPIVAVVRNPLSVLCSWNSVDMRLRDGRAPVAERLLPELARALNRIPDATSRQMHVLNWYFERYARLLPPSRVLRYEDVIASRGKALAAAVPAAASLDEDLTNRNRNELYAPQMMTALGERLLKEDGAWRRFYSPQSVEALLR